MKPEEFVSLFGEVRASAILRTPHGAAVAPAMDAAIRGGFRVVEFTLNTPGALAQIAEFSRRDGIVVGAGTVLTVEQARASVAAGAQFLVSPIVDEAVIEEAHKLGVAAMPGTRTPTEMQRAHVAGAQLQKLFPGFGEEGPDYIRACRGPLPHLKIVPTNGVDGSNAQAYFEAGAWAVGFVACLFRPEEMATGNFAAIEQRARDYLAACGAPGS